MAVWHAWLGYPRPWDGDGVADHDGGQLCEALMCTSRVEPLTRINQRRLPCIAAGLAQAIDSLQHCRAFYLHISWKKRAWCRFWPD
jgi:hypothetical protein